jgi:hypothetical protein
MNRTLSFALLVVGVILIVYGLAASDSLGSGLSRFFTGAPTDKTIWLLIGGTITSIVGGIGLISGARVP